MNIDLLLAGYFGLAINLAFQLYKHYPRIQRNGGFALGYYIKDNFPRILLGALLIPAAIKFPEFLFKLLPMIEIKPTESACFGLGVAIDTVIDALKNRKK